MEETKKEEKKKLSLDSTMLLTLAGVLGAIALAGIVYFIFKTF